MAKPTAQQLTSIYSEFQKPLKAITDKLPKLDPNLTAEQNLRNLRRGKSITDDEIMEALRILGAMDCLYDFGQLNSVSFLLPLTKDWQEQIEDTLESIYAERRLHKKNKFDGLVVAGDAIKKGYNELIPVITQNFPGSHYPKAMVVGSEAKKRRQDRKRK